MAAGVGSRTFLGENWGIFPELMRGGIPKNALSSSLWALGQEPCGFSVAQGSWGESPGQSLWGQCLCGVSPGTGAGEGFAIWVLSPRVTPGLGDQGAQPGSGGGKRKFCSSHRGIAFCYF